jgi:subtilisin family serine protease
MYSVKPQRQVEVIICDSGIMKTHDELKDAKIEDLYCIPELNGDFSDDTGHGTALASIVVGKTLGVNKNAVVKNVRISSRTKTATLGELGDAFDAIYDYHVQTPDTPKVLNLSWRIPRDAFIDHKIKRLIDAGMMVFAAAGNTDLCIDDYTPAGTDGVLTIAASTKDDREMFKVGGKDKKMFMFAPGEDIDVAGIMANDAYVYGDGSSISCALAVGVASMIFGMGDSCPSADDVATFMKHDATFNVLFINSNIRTNENFLLHSPNSHSRLKDVSIYINEFQIDALKQSGVEVPMSYLLPYFKRLPNTNYTFEIEFEDQEFKNAFASSIVLDDNTVSLHLDNAYTFDADEKYKLAKFRLLAKSNHATEESHWVLFAILHDWNNLAHVQNAVYARTDINVNFLSATTLEKDV